MDEAIYSNSSISITENTEKQVFLIMEENNIPKDHSLRVSVKGGGCSRFTYQLGFDDEQKDGDTTVELNNLRVVVDGKSLFYLTGTEFDYSSGLNGKGFIFNNPNATKSCSCGDSFGV
ncbi:MAG: iron-sulfur cluster assembly accessory protein [Ignavibacteriae bacterium]|nr:iron-sulfur cluster assembly accessory protein [Ignavibacteriota bacterium]